MDKNFVRVIGIAALLLIAIIAFAAGANPSPAFGEERGKGTPDGGEWEPAEGGGLDLSPAAERFLSLYPREARLAAEEVMRTKTPLEALLARARALTR